MTQPAADALVRRAAVRLAEASGSVTGVADPIVVSQPEEDAFAALIGDWDPMHNDPGWRAVNSDGPIVLGFHVLARLEDLVRRCALVRDAAPGFTVTTIGLSGVRFPSPFPVGATGHAEITIADAVEREGGIVLTTSHRCAVPAAAKPAMVARHTAFLTPGQAARPAPQLAGQVAMTIAGIPAGTAIPHAARHDARFFAALADRGGAWLGATPWTSVSDREAHAFALLCGNLGSNDAASLAHPFAGRPVPPLHLLALRAYFSPSVGLPVLTDDSMMAFNYGVDAASWRGAVFPGTRLRDHVQLRGVEARAPGDYLVTTRHVLEAEGDPYGVLVADCKTLYRSAT
jgi:acyl dehydratase